MTEAERAMAIERVSVVPELGVPVVRVGDCVAPRDLGAAIREGTAAGESIRERSSRL